MLNRWAWNNWTVGRAGAPFRFGGSREEVVLITGGSSGFGFEMVKGFQRVARVVVVDVVEMPRELRGCEFFFFFSFFF